MDISKYAIIRTGGQQFHVSAGEKVQVRKLDLNAGDEIRFSDVLFVKAGDRVHAGRPRVEGAEVVGEVIRQFRDKKILVFHKRPKKGTKKLQGHRQDLTEIFIKDILSGN